MGKGSIESSIESYYVECARADFFGEEPPRVFSKIRKRLSRSELSELWENRLEHSAYQKQLKKLGEDPEANIKMERINQDPKVIDNIPTINIYALMQVRENAVNILADKKRKEEHIKARKVLASI